MKKYFVSIVVLVSLIFVDAAHAQFARARGINVLNVRSLAVYGDRLFADSYDHGVFVSDDHGRSWSDANNGLGRDVRFLAVAGANLYAAAFQGKVYQSVDSGKSWKSLNADLTGWEIFSFIASGSNLYLGASYGIYHSSDAGKTWTFLTLNDPYIMALAMHNGFLFAGTGSGVYRSADNGKSWVKQPSPDAVVSLCVSNSTLYAGTPDGVARSADNGEHWSSVRNGMLNRNVRALASWDQYVFAGTYGLVGGVYILRNLDSTWTDVSTGLGDTFERSLTVSGPNLVVGNDGRYALEPGIWTRPLAEIIEEMTNKITPAPLSVILRQNYPNPFNASTTFAFSLPSKSFVSLKLYDVIGREVATILSQEFEPGSYTRGWKASGLPSGMYCYRLQAGSSSVAKRLVLVQ